MFLLAIIRPEGYEWVGIAAVGILLVSILISDVRNRD